jgi:D-alanine-D-alanine ligase-like ATP-grasp enzyme
MLCRDKAVSKMIASRNGFRVPAFFEQPPREIPFPVVVKPRDLDSSAGISAASLVTTRAALQRRIDALRRHGAVLCEEYVEGREMVVGFVGRRVMPVREMILGGRERLFSWRLKHDAEYRKRNGARMITPRLAPRVRRALEDAVLATAEGLEMHDYGRFDVRLTADGAWVFLEANPNPALVPQHRAFSKTWGGIGYDAMIEQIVRSALRRAGNGR